MSQLEKKKFDDAQAARSLQEHSKHVDGQKFLLGLHCYWIKSQINHGEFGPWLQKHLPDLCRLKNGETPQPKKQLAEAMKFCSDAAEQAGLTIDQMLEKLGKIQIPPKGGICPGGEILLLEDAKLPNDAKQLKEQLLHGIQLQLAFENGEKTSVQEASKRKKLSPSEQHAEHVKNIEANFEHAASALTLLIQMKDVDFVMAAPAERKRLADICLRLRNRVKKTKKEKAKI